MIFHYEYKIIVIANEVKEKFQNICIFAYLFLKKQADRCIISYRPARLRVTFTPQNL